MIILSVYSPSICAAINKVLISKNANLCKDPFFHLYVMSSANGTDQKSDWEENKTKRYVLFSLESRRNLLPSCPQSTSFVNEYH